MATLAQLEKYREDLESVRYSGERRVRDSNGEEVEFRSDAELSRALAAVHGAIASINRASPRISYQLTSKGV